MMLLKMPLTMLKPLIEVLIGHLIENLPNIPNPPLLTHLNRRHQKLGQALQVYVPIEFEPSMARIIDRHYNIITLLFNLQTLLLDC